MKSMSRLITVLLVGACLAVAQTDVPYRLLSSRVSGSTESIKESDYNVSVDRYPDASEIKSVVCRLIRNEKPAGYDILSVGIYYKLDQYVPEREGDVDDAALHRERRIAQYHWNKDSPKDNRRLVVSRDAKGQSLSQWRFYDFDHTKACR